MALSEKAGFTATVVDSRFVVYRSKSANNTWKTFDYLKNSLVAVITGLEAITKNINAL